MASNFIIFYLVTLEKSPAKMCLPHFHAGLLPYYQNFEFVWDGIVPTRKTSCQPSFWLKDDMTTGLDSEIVLM